jgi:hypothetical protein
MSDWPSYNTILNCESYDSYDPATGENADGFGCKLTIGVGNKFSGCYSHNNIDDGWDLYTKSATGPIGTVTIDHCIAAFNGTLTNGTTSSNGDRNGFKLGGEKISVGHIVTRCVAYKNGKNGFTWNSNPGPNFVANCLGIDNVEGNFKFGDSSTSTSAVFTNDVSYWTTTSSNQSDKCVGTDVSSTNCWWLTGSTPNSQNAKGLVVDSTDFANPMTSFQVVRNSDGSIDFSYFKLSSSSDLANAGVVPSGVTLPYTPSSYYIGTPDLGAYETR